MNPETADSLQIAKAISANPANRLSGEDNYIAGTLPADYYKQGGNGMGEMQNGVIAFNADRDGIDNVDNLSPTLTHKGDSKEAHRAYSKVAIAWHENKQGNLTPSEIAKALRSGGSHSYQGVGVRRLTPVECARLQGFPDDWNAEMSDSTRYRQFGNAVCVNVVEWIGRRIVEANNG